MEQPPPPGPLGLTRATPGLGTPSLPHRHVATSFKLWGGEVILRRPVPDLTGMVSGVSGGAFQLQALDVSASPFRLGRASCGGARACRAHHAKWRVSHIPAFPSMSETTTERRHGPHNRSSAATWTTGAPMGGESPHTPLGSSLRDGHDSGTMAKGSRRKPRSSRSSYKRNRRHNWSDRHVEPAPVRSLSIDDLPEDSKLRGLTDGHQDSNTS